MSGGSKSTTKQRFPLVAFEDIQPSFDADYLIKGVLPRNGFGVMWGKPSAGKSFHALDMAMHIACGWRYRGHRVRQGTVVYCALEGQAGFSKRIEAFKRHPDLKVRLASQSCERDVPFHMMPTALSLARDYEKFLVSVDAVGVEPDLIVLDTLNRSLEGSESSDKDMGAYIEAAGKLQEHFRCTVLVLHHPGHNNDRERGHSSLRPASDFFLKVEDLGEFLHKLTVERVKDGLAGAEFFSERRVIDLGRDRDGDLLTSCVLTPTERQEAAKSKKELAPSLKLALQVLKEHEPLTEEDWRARCYTAGISEGADRAKQLAFQRAKDQLTQMELIDFDKAEKKFRPTE